MIKSLCNRLGKLNRVAAEDATSIDDFLEMESHNVFHDYIRLLKAIIRHYEQVMDSIYREEFYKNLDELGKNEVLQEMLVQHYFPHRETNVGEIRRRKRELQQGIDSLMKIMKQDLESPSLMYDRQEELQALLKIF